ncbi:MAG TPA: restriction endonuclease [Nitrososphaerales archaeon]|nr:restriction endonuclease [Nitrososphaerales archaeon]
MISRYVKGREREYRTMGILKLEGWLVSRSAASHGAVDIFAAKGGRLLLIQVKSGRARVNRKELENLVSWGKSANGDAEVWHFKDGGKVERRRVHMARRGGGH